MKTRILSLITINWVLGLAAMLMASGSLSAGALSGSVPPAPPRGLEQILKSRGDVFDPGTGYNTARIETRARRQVTTTATGLPGYDLAWEKYIYNEDRVSADQARGMVTDAQGNVYVTGTTVANGTGVDILTMKIDVNGNIVWKQTYDAGYHNQDEGDGIGLDAQGNVYVVGTSGYTPSRTKGVVLKYDPSGTPIWTSIYDRNRLYITSVVVSSTGSVFLGGMYHSETTGFDLVVAKFRSDGVLMGDYTYDDQFHLTDCINAIALSSDESVSATGFAETGTDAADCITFTFAGNASMTRPEFYRDPLRTYNFGASITSNGLGVTSVGVYSFGHGGAEPRLTVVNFPLSWGMKGTVIESCGTGTFYPSSSIEHDADGNLIFGGLLSGQNRHGHEFWVLAALKTTSDGIPIWAVADSAGIEKGDNQVVSLGMKAYPYGTIAVAAGKWNSGDGRILECSQNGTVISASTIPDAGIAYRCAAFGGGSNHRLYLGGVPAYYASVSSTTIVSKFGFDGAREWSVSSEGGSTSLSTTAAKAIGPDGYAYYAAWTYKRVTLRKCDPATGTDVWNRDVPGATPIAIAVDEAGNVAVLSTDIDNTQYTVCRYTSAGQIRYTKHFSTPEYLHVKGVLVDDLGNTIVFGSVGAPVGPRIDAGFKITKLDPAGTELWSWTSPLGDPFADHKLPEVGVLDAAGNIYLAGAHGNEMQQVGVVLKVNSSGILQWINDAVKPDMHTIGTFDHIGLTESGDVFAATSKYEVPGVMVYGTDGAFKTVITEIPYATDPHIHGVCPTKNGGIAALTDIVSKFDGTGALLWSKQPRYTPGSLASDQSGNIFVSGFQWSEDYYREMPCTKYTPDGDIDGDIVVKGWDYIYDGADVTADKFGGVYLCGIMEYSNHKLITGFVVKYQLQDSDLPISITYSTNALNIGSVAIGCNQTVSFTLTNDQNLGVRVDSVVAIGPELSEYTLLNKNVSVPPHSTAKISVNFRPYVLGQKECRFLVYRHAVPAPDTVEVLGTASGTGNDLVMSIAHQAYVWKLASIPVQPVCPLEVTGDWYAFNSGYKLATAPAPKSGYWIKYGSASSVTFAGQPITPHTIPVKAKWNLIGALSQSVNVADVTSDPPGILLTNIYRYDPLGGYVPAENLEPGSAYWVKTLAAGDLILGSAGASAGKTVRASVQNSAPGYRITFTDAKGATRTLNINPANMNETELSRFDLPPVPPEGVFDVRYRTGRNVIAANNLNAAGAEISLAGASLPVTIEWSEPIPGAMLHSAAGVTDLNRPGKLRIQNAEGTLRISGDGVVSAKPMEFALLPNFPNPFNPATTIRFMLPEAAPVRLDVYNVIGQLVTRLIDQQMTAGYHQIRWNASSSPSGVYYYTIHTGTNTQTRKMLLMR